MFSQTRSNDQSHRSSPNSDDFDTCDEDYNKVHYPIPIKLWPRNTQVIKIPHSATILHALLDFDNSVVGAAWNGETVVVTFASLWSLLTGTLFVTPVVFSETACQKRITKYAGRGFLPFIYDPHNLNPVQEKIQQNILPHWNYPLELPTNQHSIQVEDCCQEFDSDSIYGLGIMSIKNKPQRTTQKWKPNENYNLTQW